VVLHDVASKDVVVGVPAHSTRASARVPTSGGETRRASDSEGDG
jgi:serine acetyltransferase